MRLIIIGMFIGLLLGGAIGYFVGGTWSVSSIETEGGSRPLLEDSAGRKLLGEGSPPSPGASEQAIETVPVPEGALRGFLRSLPSIEPHKGQGTITVKVRTVDGEPISGARVRAAPKAQSSPFHAVDSDESNEAAIIRVASELQWVARSAIEGFSDEAGISVLRGVGPASYSVGVTSGELEFTSPQRTSTVRSGGELEFIGTPLFGVDLRVRYRDGRVPDRALINIEKSFERSKTTIKRSWLPTKPLLKLVRGPVTLRAIVGDPSVAESGKVTLDPGELQGVVTELILDETYTVGGRIRVASGDHFESLQVALVARETSTSLKSISDIAHEERVSIDGRGDLTYRFTGVKPGQYTLVFARSNEPANLGRVDLSVTGHDVNQDIELPPIDSSLVFTLRVKDPSGRPLSNLHYAYVNYAFGSNSWGTEVKMKPAGRGTYRVWPELPADLVSKSVSPSNVEFRMFVAHEEYLGVQFAAILGEDKEIDVSFAQPGQLIVRMEGLSASALADKLSLRLLSLFPLVGDSGQEDQTGVGDEFAFKKCIPGKHRMRVMIGSDRLREAVEEHDLVILSGVTTISLPLPDVHVVRVVVMDEPAGSTGTASRLIPDGAKSEIVRRSTATDGNGQCEFMGLPSGDYELRFGSKTMRIVVPTSGVVTFRQSSADQLLVRIQAQSGYLARSGLEDGDVILETGSQQGKHAQPLLMEVLAMLNGSARDSTVMILRRGQKIDLTLKPSLQAVSEAGGELLQMSR